MPRSWIRFACISSILFALPAFGAGSTDHYGYLEPRAVAVSAPRNCPARMNSSRFAEILKRYRRAYNDPSKALQKLDLSSEITTAVFCAVGTQNYAEFIGQIGSDARIDQEAFTDLAMVLQNHWQTQYALGLATIQQQRMDKVSSYSWKLEILVGALGLIPKVPKLSSYFYIAQQMFPLLLPGAVIGGDHYIDRRGMFDGKYPPQPADLLKIDIPSENDNYNSYELWKDLGVATASVVGSQVAFKLLGTVSEAISLGKFSFNPVTIIGSLLVGEAVQVLSQEAIDEYEYHKLKNKLLQDRDGVISAIANGDEVDVVAQATELEHTAIMLSSFLDAPTVNAWAKYSQTVQSIEKGSSWKTWVGSAIAFYTNLTPEYFFPTRADDKIAIAKAATKRDEQIQTIQAAEDPVSLSDVQLAVAMNAMQHDSKIVGLLPVSEQEQGNLISKGYPLSGMRSYPQYVGILEDDQIQSLDSNFRNGQVYKNPSHVLLEVASFIEALNDPRLQSIHDDLMNILCSGELIQN